VIQLAKVILICGKICSGKTFYAKKLKEEFNAVILSTDEVTKDLIDNEQGEFYNVFAKRVNLYLRKKAAEIVKAGANVILDWGFWTKKDRKEIIEYFKNQGIDTCFYYIKISDADWKKNIGERNALIEKGKGGCDFYVDEGLKNKLLSLFEEPLYEEVDIIINNER